MASNNQRAPSVPLPTRWSNDGKKNAKEQQQIVLNQVREMFGTILDRDIILSVVQNCKWELQPSIEALIMLSENAETPLSHDQQSYANLDSSIKVRGDKMVKNETLKTVCDEISEDKDKGGGGGGKLATEFEESVSGFLNFNDKELLRQQNEFRKFELLKKDLSDKGGFVNSSVNENLSKSGYNFENDKITPTKLRQFGNNSCWKNDYSKVYYCSEVENANNQNQQTGGGQQTVNQLWDKNSASSNNEQRKTKETNNQLENLFGSKLQFSRDISPKNNCGKGGGTIPKNNRITPPQSDSGSSSNSSNSSSQWQQQQQKQQQSKEKKNFEIDKTSGNVKNFNENSASKISNNEFSYRSNSAGDYNQTSKDVNPSSQDPMSQQQVSQFDSNYDNETKTRTASGKSNVHKGETESLCGLKVQYRLPGLENSSDDDADVVIEEERPDYPTQIPSLLSTNVCHFISSSTLPRCNSPLEKSRPESRDADSSSSSSPKISPQHNTYDNKLKNIISSILKGHKVLIIIRGLPGSGKSHLATNIVKSSLGGDERQFVFSTDDYFMLGNGVYNYVRSKLSEAHASVQRKVSNALKDGVSPVIVANTNTQSWEMQPYVVMGVQNGYAIEILEPSTPWSRNLNELVRKNSHGVLKESIKKMIERYEHNLTAQKLIEQFGLRYSADKVPPQMRKFPPISIGGATPEQQQQQQIADGEKVERQKPAAKRNRRRKKNQANGSGSLTDSVNCLLSDSDKNIKRQAESTRVLKRGNDTLEEIVSNALRSENETLNKSLVDYCIETDSGDEIDTDSVPRSISDNKEVDLFGENITDENNTSSNLSVKNSSSSSSASSSSSSAAAAAALPIDKIDEKNSPIVNEEANDDDDDNSRLKSSNEFTGESSTACNDHQNQNLGAIGSERKESVPTIDFKPLLNFVRDNESDNENSLSQCWDFTLLIGDRKIHSDYRASKTVRRPKPKIDQIKTEVEKTVVDYESGVIITEITEETEIEFRKADFTEPETSTEDSDTIMDKIMAKMDENELETKFDEETSVVKTDFGAELVYAEPEASFETPGGINDRKDSPQDRKDSLKYREGTMKYKHQTNDNSLSENDAFENEMLHREPSLFVTAEDEKAEGEDSIDLNETEMKSATIDDSLSEKLTALTPDETIPATDFERNSCRVSEPVTFDNLILTGVLEGVVDDTLSTKLSEESIRETGDDVKSETELRMRSSCVSSSLESSFPAINECEETKHEVESNVDGKNLLGFEKGGEKPVAQITTEMNEETTKVDIKEEEVDQTARNLSLIKTEDDDIDESNTREKRETECEKIAQKLENSINNTNEENIPITSNITPDGGIKKEAPELPDKIEEDKLNIENDKSGSEVIPPEKSTVDEDGLRFTLKTISSEDGDLVVLVDVNKDETGSLETISDGGSSMAVCCEDIDENGCPFPEGPYWERERENAVTIERTKSEENEDDGFVEYKTSDDSGVGNTGNERGEDEMVERDRERKQECGVEEKAADEIAVEIIDNINRVTWKESPFPLPPSLINSSSSSGSSSNSKSVNEARKELNPVMKSESSTNTSDYDFNVSYVGGTSEYKTINGKSRNINSGLSLTRSCVEEKPPLKLMLDKSSMTSVVNILSGEETGLESKTEVEALKDVDELTEMFPNVPRENITDIYRNLCNGDFNWAVDMLLDGVPDQVSKYAKIDPPRIILDKQTSSGSSSAALGGISESSDSQNSTPHKERLDKLRQRSSSLESNDNTDPKLNYSPKKKKDRHKVSEETLELKRQIEEKMVINQASYNPHILKVKRWKNGEPDIPTIDDNGGIESAQSQTRSVIEFCQIPSTKNNYGEEESCEVSDVKQSSPKSSESTDDFTEDEIEPEEMMELNLGEGFIKVLETEFGNPNFNIPDGLFPVIQIKKSMAQQLHALWIESMEQQMNAQQEQLDKMIEKDAEFARSLEQEEARNIEEPIVPNLSEIMDMDMALAIYNNDLKKQLKLETPNDMASRLTRQLLHEMFVDHDPETLNEILNAHHGNFKETVDVLEASTGQIADRNSTLKKQKSLIDRAKKESIRSDKEEYDRFMVDSSTDIDSGPSRASASDSDAGLTYDDAIEEAMSSRQEAQRQLMLRNENFNKAKEAFRKGNRDVAGYYSELAKLHKKRMEIANSTAASAFLAAQDYRMNAANTLDLHYLYVAEALEALDVFLDYHISKLNQSNKKSINLYIITGRGARSSGGYSKLKPAVSKKLASKNLRYMEENAGCLKIVIHRRNNT